MMMIISEGWCEEASWSLTIGKGAVRTHIRWASRYNTMSSASRAAAIVCRDDTRNGIFAREYQERGTRKRTAIWDLYVAPESQPYISHRIDRECPTHSQPASLPLLTSCGLIFCMISCSICDNKMPTKRPNNIHLSLSASKKPQKYIIINGLAIS